MADPDPAGGGKADRHVAVAPPHPPRPSVMPVATGPGTPGGGPSTSHPTMTRASTASALRAAAGMSLTGMNSAAAINAPPVASTARPGGVGGAAATHAQASASAIGTASPGAGATGTGGVTMPTGQSMDVAVAARRPFLRSYAPTQQFTHADLRHMFRLIDADNDAGITYHELRTGLIEAGFALPSDPTAVGRLFALGDRGHTGKIGEEGFIALFAGKSRPEIQRFINSLAPVKTERAGLAPTVSPGQPHVHHLTAVVTITSYGGGKAASADAHSIPCAPPPPPTLAHGATRTRVHTCSHLVSFLDDHVLALDAGVDGRCTWIDVMGYDEEAISVLCDRLNLDRDLVDASYVMQKQKVDMVWAKPPTTVPPKATAPSPPHATTVAGGGGPSGHATGATAAPSPPLTTIGEAQPATSDTGAGAVPVVGAGIHDVGAVGVAGSEAGRPGVMASPPPMPSPLAEAMPMASPSLAALALQESQLGSYLRRRHGRGPLRQHSAMHARRGTAVTLDDLAGVLAGVRGGGGGGLEGMVGAVDVQPLAITSASPLTTTLAGLGQLQAAASGTAAIGGEGEDGGGCGEGVVAPPDPAAAAIAYLPILRSHTRLHINLHALTMVHSPFMPYSMAGRLRSRVFKCITCKWLWPFFASMVRGLCTACGVTRCGCACCGRVCCRMRMDATGHARWGHAQEEVEEEEEVEEPNLTNPGGEHAPAAHPRRRADASMKQSQRIAAQSARRLVATLGMMPGAGPDPEAEQEGAAPLSTRHGCACLWCERHAPTSAPLVLASAGMLQHRAPQLHTEQFSIVLVSDHLILTFRAGESVVPASATAPELGGSGNGAASGGSTEPGALLRMATVRNLLRRPETAEGGGSAAMASGAPSPALSTRRAMTKQGVGKDESVLDVLFAGMQARLLAEDGTMEPPPSVRTLATELMALVGQFNFGVRDQVKEWSLAVESQFQHTTSRKLAPHLYSLTKVADQYRCQLEPLMDMVNEAHNMQLGFMVQSLHGSGGRGVAEDGGGGEDERGSVGRGRVGSVGVGRGGDDGDWATASTTRGGGGMPTLVTMSLAQYFMGDLPIMVGLKDDCNTIHAEMSTMLGHLAALKTMLNTLQGDMMNRLILVLTVVTVVVQPFTLVSGYFGMNFDDMSELTAMTGGFGVKTFWVAAPVFLAIILLFLWRLGLSSLMG